MKISWKRFNFENFRLELGHKVVGQTDWSDWRLLVSFFWLLQVTKFNRSLVDLSADPR